MTDPREKHHDEGFPDQEQKQPGLTSETAPTPDHGEESYRGSGRLEGRRALITGGDSGIGRAVAIAFAREGADVAIAHLPKEQEDADATVALIEQAGRRGLSFAGDVRDEAFATRIVVDTAEEFGAVLVVAAADVRGAGRGAIAETGRESVGAGRGRDLITVGAVAIGIEDERFTAVAALQRRATAERDIGAIEILRPVARGGSAVLSHGRDSQHRRRRSDEERGEFHIFSPLFE